MIANGRRDMGRKPAKVGGRGKKKRKKKERKKECGREGDEV